MIEELKKILGKKKIDFWKISSVESERSNIYYELDEEENYISGKRTDVFVTVYKKSGKTLGESTVSVKEGDDYNEKIDEAILAASLVKNPAYSPFDIYEGYPPSGKGKTHAFEELKKKAQEAYAEMKGKAGRINALEILTKRTKATITNSLGKTAVNERSGAYFEIVVTCKGKRGEQEYVAMVSEGDLERINAKQFAARCFSIASEISNSDSPEMFKGDVIISGDAVAEYFVPELRENPLVTHCAAKMKYLKISRFEEGKQIVPEIKGDRITIISNPLIKDGLMSSAFDDNMVPAQRTVLIQDSKMKTFFASKRYADYLKIKPTGPLGNIEVLPGNVSENDLRKDGVCEIIGFSSFAPNVYSGDFTAEIRLGYFYKNGKKIPFKGGMLVGNCMDLMRNIKISKETFFKSGYYGPKAVLFKDCVVTGV